MRFPALFEPRLPHRTGQPQERVPARQAVPAVVDAEPRVVAPDAPPEPPEDLDQRVRQIGEWQLEDW